MSDSQKDEEKNNDGEEQRKRRGEVDPYNFFRLSTDPAPDGGDDREPRRRPTPPRFPLWGALVAGVAILALVNLLFMQQKPEEQLIEFSTFRQLIEDGKIVRVEMGETVFTGYGPEEERAGQDGAGDRQQQLLRNLPWMREEQPSNRPVYKTTGVLLAKFIELLDEKGVQYKFVSKQSSILLQIFINILPFLIIIGIYFFMFRKMTGGLGGGALFGGGGSRSKAVDEGKVKTRFADVAGVDEAKEELVEIVDFLKEPKKYTEIGGKIPKGVLLVGPPGTGKTLLARAVAGEAGVPFFRISGSDFVEMFVGVGASRVRDLFKQAREKAPCIIFIDELDAIGKSRVNSLGGNDEREQTLNQMLVEMDGFDNEKGLIVLAATNRPDILDPALLRPGRFDRQVSVDKPDVKGREAILRIHAKSVKVDPSVNFENLAHATSGFAGADLANIVNEAALLAVRNGRKAVIMEDFDEAIEKVIIGLKKKSRVAKEKERVSVAYHETGHALVAAFTPDSDPVHKITIIPRGTGALGYTMYRSEDEQFLYTRSDLLGRVDGLLGGRAAEEVVFGREEITTGASNDISRATDIVKRMITDYGMSERFRNVTLGRSGRGYDAGEPALVREFSEETQRYIDDEIARVMDERYARALGILREHRDTLEFVARRLLEIETMEGDEFNEIVRNAVRCKAIEEKARSDGEASAENHDSSGNSDSAKPDSEDIDSTGHGSGKSDSAESATENSTDSDSENPPNVVPLGKDGPTDGAGSEG